MRRFPLLISHENLKHNLVDITSIFDFLAYDKCNVSIVCVKCQVLDSAF